MPYYDAINWAVETLSAKRIVALPTGSSAAPTLELAGVTTLSGTTTISGTLNTTGAVTSSRLPTVNLAAATQGLTAAQSGQTFVGAVDAVFTLPAAATVGAGIHYYIVTGVASGGTGLRCTANAADTLFAAGVTTGAGGNITNSGATDVNGDGVHLVSD